MMAGRFTIILLLGLNPSVVFLRRIGDISPANPYVFIGETLNLTCTLTNVASYPGNVSESLFFTTMFGEEELPLPSEYISILDTRSIQLTYPITSGGDKGGYTCLLNRTSNKPKVVKGTFLTVEHRPIAVTEVHTVVDDWATMTVTWNLGQEYINLDLVNFRLLWTRNYPAMFECPHLTKTSCLWKRNDGKDSLMMVAHHMYILVETQKDSISRNVTDSVFSEWFTIPKPDFLVKPAPVQNLRISNRSSSCIYLTWDRSQNSRYKHILCYVTVNPLEETKSTTETLITIRDLQPARSYSFNVSCIPKPYGLEPRGYYSDTRVVEAVTNEDVPSGAPKMATDNFRYHDCPETPNCTVTVYWQSVSEEERNGEIIAYQIKAIDATTDTTKTFTTLGSKRTHDIVVNKDRDYRIEVKASTAIGYSEGAAILILPARDKKLPYPSNFLVEKQDRELYVSWTHPPETTPTGYTLYYCNGFTFRLTCVNDELNWVHLSANQTTFKLPMSDTNLDNQLVGISAESEKDNQNLTSGILWSLCTYVKYAKPAKPSNVHFSPEQPSNALRVNWDEALCRMDTPYITQYVLTYCKGNTDGCSGPMVNQSITNTAQSHVIKNFPVGKSYRVTLRAMSSSGAGPESDPISRQVINSDNNIVASDVINPTTTTTTTTTTTINNNDGNVNNVNTLTVACLVVIFSLLVVIVTLVIYFKVIRPSKTSGTSANADSKYEHVYAHYDNAEVDRGRDPLPQHDDHQVYVHYDDEDVDNRTGTYPPDGDHEVSRETRNTYSELAQYEDPDSKCEYGKLRLYGNTSGPCASVQTSNYQDLRVYGNQGDNHEYGKMQSK